MLIEFITKSLAYLFEHCNINENCFKNIYYTLLLIEVLLVLVLLLRDWSLLLIIDIICVVFVF